MFCLQLGGLLNLLSDFTCGLGTGQHWMISPTVNILVDCHILDFINGLADLIIIWLWIGTSWTRVMQSRQAHKLQAAHRTLAGLPHFSHSEDLRDTIWNSVEKLRNSASSFHWLSSSIFSYSVLPKMKSCFEDLRSRTFQWGKKRTFE